MKKIFTYFFFFTLLSNAFAYSENELLVEVENHISKLNTIMNSNVKVKLQEECGFSTTLPVDDIHFIYFCMNDLSFFSKLPNQADARQSLLTIISHEYSHTLLDWDESKSSYDITEEFIQKVSELIYEKFENDNIVIDQLRRYKLSMMSGRDDIDFNTVEGKKDVIVDFLMFVDHSNNDSLAVKLMQLVEEVPDTKVMNHLLAMYDMEPTRELNQIVRARNEVLQDSLNEGLSSWESYNCIVDGRGISDSNVVLKEALLAHSLLKVKAKISSRCSVEDTILKFNELLDIYIPRL